MKVYEIIIFIILNFFIFFSTVQSKYIFVSNELFQDLGSCSTGDNEEIFGNSLSDHLPVIADFDLA